MIGRATVRSLAEFDFATSVALRQDNSDVLSCGVLERCIGCYFSIFTGLSFLFYPAAIFCC